MGLPRIVDYWFYRTAGLRGSARDITSWQTSSVGAPRAAAQSWRCDFLYYLQRCAVVSAARHPSSMHRAGASANRRPFSTVVPFLGAHRCRINTSWLLFLPGSGSCPCQTMTWPTVVNDDGVGRMKSCGYTDIVYERKIGMKIGWLQENHHYPWPKIRYVKIRFGLHAWRGIGTKLGPDQPSVK